MNEERIEKIRRFLQKNWLPVVNKFKETKSKIHMSVRLQISLIYGMFMTLFGMLIFVPIGQVIYHSELRNNILEFYYGGQFWKIALADVEYAKAWGGVIKLIARAKKLEDGRVSVMVSPAFIQNHSQLASVDDVFNAILVRGDAIGDVVFYGKGAGKLPTASAVVGDIIDVAHGVVGGSVKRPYFENATAEDTADFGDYTCARYFRFANTANEVTEALGERVQQLVTLDGYVAVITKTMSERQAVAAVADKLCVCSAMRVL